MDYDTTKHRLTDSHYAELMCSDKAYADRMLESTAASAFTDGFDAGVIALQRSVMAEEDRKRREGAGVG